MIKLKKNILFLLLLCVYFSCSNKENVLEGDLYFVLLDASNYYVIDEDRRATFKETADQLMEKDSLSVEEEELLSQYQFLNRNDILDKPKIHLRTFSGDIKEVFLPLSDFKKVSNYSLTELRKENERVHLKMTVDTTRDGLLLANDVFYIKKETGPTFYKQNNSD